MYSSPQPVCGPARSSIFTGFFPHSNGCVSNGIAPASNIKNIGQRLQENSITTGYIGKWHLDGGDYFGFGVCPDGWNKEYWYDMRCYMEELTMEERVKSRDPMTCLEGIDESFTFAHRCSNKAIEFLSNHCDNDFFLTVSYDEPHGPYLCPEPFASMYEDYEFPKSPNVWDTLENKPDYQKVWAGDSRFIDRNKLKIKPRFYLGCNSFADYEIGRVIDAINQFAPDALIIYTSDHGDFLDSHCLSNKGPAFYDEIARVPLIIKGGEIGKVYEHPASHIDIAPTVLDYMGLDVPKCLAGTSLMPVINNIENKVRDYAFTEFTRYEMGVDGFGGLQMMRSITDGRYKLSVNLLDSDELYDTQVDPYEMNNLINDENYSETRNNLHDGLLDFMNNTRDPYRGYYWERRPWRKDARPATWDYTGYSRQYEREKGQPKPIDYLTGLEVEETVRIKGEVESKG